MMLRRTSACIFCILLVIPTCYTSTESDFDASEMFWNWLAGSQQLRRYQNREKRDATASNETSGDDFWSNWRPWYILNKYIFRRFYPSKNGTVPDTNSTITVANQSLPSTDTHDRASNDIMTRLNVTKSINNTNLDLGVSSCNACSSKLNVLVPLRGEFTEEDLERQRVEKIKKEILRKLGLKSPPNITASKPMLPELPMFKPDRNEYESQDVSKIREVLIMAEQGTGQCNTERSAPSNCFSFNMSSYASDSEFLDVGEAQLWVFLTDDAAQHLSFKFSSSQLRQRIAVYVIRPREDNQLLDNDLFDKRDVRIDTTIKYHHGGWIKFDITDSVKRWLDNPGVLHQVEVSCMVCKQNLDRVPVVMEGGYTPFLALYPRQRTYSKRSKRHIDCTPDVQVCCKEKLYVSFTDIGWDDWIISPLGYWADFCRGSCIQDVSASLAATHHATIIQNLLGSPTAQVPPELLALIAPCCVPTRMSPLSLLYINENLLIIKKDMPNMIVDSCGCS